MVHRYLVLFSAIRLRSGYQVIAVKNAYHDLVLQITALLMLSRDNSGSHVSAWCWSSGKSPHYRGTMIVDTVCCCTSIDAIMMLLRYVAISWEVCVTCAYASFFFLLWVKCNPTGYIPVAPVAYQVVPRAWYRSVS